MNSFMLFSQEQRAKIHLANPNRDNRNVSKILGEKWYSLSPHEQEQYKIRAKQLRHEHFKQNPSFKWTNPLSKPTTTMTAVATRLSPTTKNKDEQEQCRRSARLQSQSNQEKNLSPLCDRLQAFAQVCSRRRLPSSLHISLLSKICTHMPKLTEQSNQRFSPISKPSEVQHLSSSSNADLITPVPLHPSPRTDQQVHLSLDLEKIEFHQTAFRAHSSTLPSTSTERSKDSASSSPELSSEKNSHVSMSENETCRAIVSMLIHQRQTNANLEQQLKDLQTTHGQPTSPSKVPSRASLFPPPHHHLLLRKCPFSLSFFVDDSSSRLASSASSSRLSQSTGYSSGSSSSSMDSQSTILSAYSSRSNSSLSERSKTSPTPIKQIAIQYLPTISESNVHLSLLDTPSTSKTTTTTKRRKTVSLEVRRSSQSNRTFIDFISERTTATADDALEKHQ